jgi:hypothetical protein
MWKHIETGEIILPTNASLCKKLKANITNYRLIGYKKWNIEIVK